MTRRSRLSKDTASVAIVSYSAVIGRLNEAVHGHSWPEYACIHSELVINNREGKLAGDCNTKSTARPDAHEIHMSLILLWRGVELPIEMFCPG